MTENRNDDTAKAGAAETGGQQVMATPAESKRWTVRNTLKVAGITLLIAVLLAGAGIGYLYASSPISVREPLLEHYHFRMQVLVDGKAENFGAAEYQTPYDASNCNVALPDHPIHFHDGKDQFVHIHWEGVTGGQVLKYYGWNFIGGLPGALGYRFDQLPDLERVPIHGTPLPQIPDDAQFFVYTGSAERYQQKSLKDFTHQDLEVFFDKTSNFPAHKLNQEKRNSLLDDLFPKAHADTGHQHGDAADGRSEQELTRINNLIGDVVIFVQKDKPSDQQIKDRFNKLVPLGDSTCGG